MTIDDVSDETLEAMARAHDEEDAAMRGEPSPWRGMDDPTRDPIVAAQDREFRAERLASMGRAVRALAACGLEIRPIAEIDPDEQQADDVAPQFAPIEVSMQYRVIESHIDAGGLLIIMKAEPISCAPVVPPRLSDEAKAILDRERAAREPRP